MPAPRGRKRKSDQSTTSTADNYNTQNMTVPTKTGSSTEESPRKRRKIGITLTQKQALIDNLQLEITERARKLRAQYNLQAQGLRTRIEIRVNRIPMALRKAKMADLLQKYSDDRKQKPAAPLFAAPLSARPPPVPEKDAHMTRPLSQRSASPVKAPATRPGPGRPPKRKSDELGDTNKENEIEHVGPKKRLRGHPAPEAAPHPSQILSPTSSNTRVIPRDRAPPSPVKSMIARPVSPTKQNSATNIISNMVEKARSTRAAATTRKTTTSSTASSAAGGTTAATRARRGAAAAPATATRTAATRTAKRVSGISESSDGSTSTVVRKPTGRAAAAAATKSAPAAKRTVMSTIRKGVAGATTKKAPTTKAAAAPASTATGRVLRKRN